jgi:hypothetical protein
LQRWFFWNSISGCSGNWRNRAGRRLLYRGIRINW